MQYRITYVTVDGDMFSGYKESEIKTKDVICHTREELFRIMYDIARNWARIIDCVEYKKEPTIMDEYYSWKKKNG